MRLVQVYVTDFPQADGDVVRVITTLNAKIEASEASHNRASVRHYLRITAPYNRTLLVKVRKQGSNEPPRRVYLRDIERLADE